MSQDTFNVILWMLPLAIGGLIAAVNSNQSNEMTERAEGWLRLRQQGTSARAGWVSAYILNPLLWTIVKFCDWTDGFAHRGLKNGTRVSISLYLVGLWLVVLYAALIIAIALVIIAVVFYIAAKVISSSNDGAKATYARSRPAERDDEALAHAGVAGKKIYAGTNWFNEELKGRVDEEGNLYKGTNWFNEEKIGRIDDEGNIYSGTSWANEVKVGRIDRDGTLYKGSNWFTEEKTGRIDEDGTIHKGTNWFNEEKKGRTGD
jgi:hypothetical protein